MRLNAFKRVLAETLISTPRHTHKHITTELLSPYKCSPIDPLHHMHGSVAEENFDPTIFRY